MVYIRTRLLATRKKECPDHSLLTGLRSLFGQPLHKELRVHREFEALTRHQIFRGVGVPAGHGRPILLIPGFFARATSVMPLQQVLSLAGWNCVVARVGKNSGPAYIGVNAAMQDLARTAGRTKEKVTLIGHSRGGQFARLLAVRTPEVVTQVITIASPLLVKYPRQLPMRAPIEVLDWLWRTGAFGPISPSLEDAVDDDRYRSFPAEIDFVSIFSKSDGIVDWRACRDPHATHIEVDSSHLGMSRSVQGIEAVARALARQDQLTNSAFKPS